MSTIPVSCPHCAFSRDVPEDKVPDRPVRATCPKCSQSFDFHKSAPPPVAASPSGSSAPRPQPDSRQTAPGQPAAKPQRVPPTSAPHRRETGALPAEPAPAASRRPLLLGLILLAVIIGAVVKGDLAGRLPSLLKPGSMPGQGRQIITIPPPSGELPAAPPLNISPAGAPQPATPPVPAMESGPVPGGTTGGSQLRATDLSVFIYAVNVPGTIRVNGQEFRVIKSEPDMQYNINAFGDHFRSGENTIDFDVVPNPGDGKRLSPAIHMKVSRGNKLLAEWRLPDKDGWPRSLTVNVPAEQTP